VLSKRVEQFINCLKSLVSSVIDVQVGLRPTKAPAWGRFKVKIYSFLLSTIKGSLFYEFLWNFINNLKKIKLAKMPAGETKMGRIFGGFSRDLLQVQRYF
jgi:hypothetical protein